MSYFNKLFGIYRDDTDEFCYFLGLKLRFIFEKERRKKERNLIREELANFKGEILEGVQKSIATALLHQKTFREFKNKYVGKTIVVVGAGPTLNYFEKIDNAIYVGVNRTFLYEKIKFDYLFAIDKVGLETGTNNYTNSFLNYKGNNCIKFIGDCALGKNFQIPESKLYYSNIRRYKQNIANGIPSNFTLDIDSEPLGSFHSVVFQAMQFILYTNPAKVYLVGMDCNINTAGHFVGNVAKVHLRGTSVEVSDQKNLAAWQKLKIFANTYYPDTEIISINPVGLKGLFEDIYTENYLKYLDSKERV